MQIKSASTLFLLLTIAVTLVAVPLVVAHDPPLDIPTWAFLSCAPNPIGVGQTTYVNFWLDKVPPTANSAYGDKWENMNVEVTDPNGDKETLGPFTSDAVGGAWTEYTPTEEGTYKFVFTFPGQTIEGKNPHPIFGTSSPEYIGDYYEPATSDTVELVVQQDPIERLPVVPLPTEYWTRPVISVNSQWHQISGNWLGLASSTFAATGMYNATGNFNPYTTAPNTGHIVWTKPEAFGGLIGGEFGGSQTSNYYSTSQYEPKFAPIIINGILYYMQYPGSQANPAGWVAVDLRTGQEIWTKDTDTPLSCGETYNYISPNQYGGLAYLWTGPSGFFAMGGDWNMYDAMTGNWILKIENGSSGTRVEADDGALLLYYTSFNFTDGTNWLNMWNSSKCILGSVPPDPFYQESSWMWRPPQGATLDFSVGIEWTVPVATEVNGKPIIGASLGISSIATGVILMTARTGGFGFSDGWQIEAGYSADDGHLVWGPINRTIPYQTAYGMGPAMNGVYTAYSRETFEWWGYSIKTGTKLWGPVKSTESNVFGYYGVQYVAAYGNLYEWDLGGTVNCIDLQTGDIKWTYNTGSSGYETPYGIWPLWTFSVGTVADGKLYVPEGHMYSPPLFYGAQQLCLNATTGELIWSILGFDVTSAPAIADGYMVTLNAYDNQIYCYGKGQTATTVSAPDIVQTLGTPVLIQGTVMDKSPGTEDDALTARFPNGVPAIADKNMSAWMEYLYMQQPKPQDANGVTVKLETLDPNGNYYDIGTVTSDATGMYKLMWEPPVPGEYTIIATFAGSESYWPSYAATAIGVTEAPPTPAPEEPLTLPPTETYITGATIAIILAIVIVGILILRKH